MIKAITQKNTINALAVDTVNSQKARFGNLCWFVAGHVHRLKLRTD